MPRLDSVGRKVEEVTAKRLAAFTLLGAAGNGGVASAMAAAVVEE